MFARCSILMVLFGLFVIGTAKQLCAQEKDQTSTVSVTGEATFSIKPSCMRLIFTTESVGPEENVALEGLKKQKKKIEEQLNQFKSKPSSIRFEKLRLSRNSNRTMPNQHYVVDPFGEEPRLEEEMFEGEDSDEDEKELVLVSTTYKVIADWQVSTTDATDLLVMKLELLKWVRDQKLTSYVSPEAAEIASSMQLSLVEEDDLFSEELMLDFDSSVEIESLDSFKIYYLGRWSEDQRKETLQKAFEDAKSNAILLAVAANKELGRVAKIQYGSMMEDPETYISMNYSHANQVFDDSEEEEMEIPKEDEAMSSRPDGLYKIIQLDVEFEIE